MKKKDFPKFIKDLPDIILSEDLSKFGFVEVSKIDDVCRPWDLIVDRSLFDSRDSSNVFTPDDDAVVGMFHINKFTGNGSITKILRHVEMMGGKWVPEPKRLPGNKLYAEPLPLP